MTNDTSAIWLQRVLGEKIQQNPSYSLRSFAKKLGVSPSYLSRLITRKKQMSFKMALQIAEALALSPIEKGRLCQIVTDELENQNRVSHKIDDQTTIELTQEAFTAIAEWHHYGITQLINLHNFREDNNWISKMLNVNVVEVKLAIERLIRLGILARDEDGNLFRTVDSIETTKDVRSSGLRHFHRQILEKSILSLEENDLLERDITSITMAINEELIPMAKKEIEKFRKQMSKKLQQGKLTRVYNLGIHFIPLSNREGDVTYDN